MRVLHCSALSCAAATRQELAPGQVRVLWLDTEPPGEDEDPDEFEGEVLDTAETKLTVVDRCACCRSDLCRYPRRWPVRTFGRLTRCA